MYKKLIICSDGTWNYPTQNKDGKPCPSNVYKFACGLAPTDSAGREQVIFYDEGIGARENCLFRAIKGFTGLGIDKNIEDAYRFIMHNYNQGDEIHLVGFSRGAYTVRSTAGMLRKCGLLKKEFIQMYPEAETLYRDKHHPNCEVPVKFRSNYSREVEIKSICVWDTVGSLGIPVDGLRFFNRFFHNQFHDVKLSSHVKFGFQALAIDEHRSSFKPAIWEIQEHSLPGQTVKQVWFTGAHTDIGGGGRSHGLSDIAFNWMMACGSEAGLEFCTDNLKEFEIRPDYISKIYNSRTCIYKVLPPYYRPIGKAVSSNEAVSEEAVKRYNDPAAKYHPPNLVEYIERDESNPVVDV